MLYPRSARKAV